MRALLWKEFRENLKWALLGALALGGALCYGLYQTSYGEMTFSSYEGITLLRKQFLLVTTFGFPAFGLFLGLVQVLPELKRDRWAALLHRPVSHEMIFLGKILAGVILYGIAALFPFAMAVWLVATPGNFAAPFVPGLMLPGLADLLVGLVYYFAAFAMTLQRRGWAERCLPLLAALYVSYFVLGTSLFRVAAESALAMALALGVASWGIIGKPESLAERSLLTRFALVAVMFYGVCGLGEFGKSLLEAVGPEPRRQSVQYEISKDGVPLRLTYLNSVVTDVTDAQGRPLDDPKLSKERIRNETSYLNTVSSYIGDSHGWKPREWKASYRQTELYLSVGNVYQFPQNEQWFGFVPERSWICYVSSQKKPVSRLDAGGFQPVSAAPVAFSREDNIEGLRSDCYVIWNQTSVRLAYLAKRKIVDLPLPGPLPIYGLAGAYAQSPQGPVRVTVFALKDGLAVYDDSENLIAFVPYTRDVSKWGRIEVGVNSGRDRLFLWYNPSSWIDQNEAKTMPTFLEVVDLKGQVLTSTTLDPLPAFPWERSLTQMLTQRLQSPALFFGEMGYRKVGAIMGSTRLENALKFQLVHSWPQTRELLIWMLGLSLCFAGVAYFQARRAHLVGGRVMAWTLFVFAFNLAGFLVFRLAADWPRQTACAQCRKPRPIDRGLCPSCGKGWETPDPTGTEIISPLPAPASLAQTT